MRPVDAQKKVFPRYAFAVPLLAMMGALLLFLPAGDRALALPRAGLPGGATVTTTTTPIPTPTCAPLWSIVSSPNPSSYSNYLFGVVALAANDIWAVGTYQYAVGASSQTLALHWDGNQWSIIPSPNVGTENNYLLGVEAVSSNDVWAVGYCDNTDHTLIEHWDGSQWSIIPSPNGSQIENELRGVSAISPNDVWAAGDYVENIGGYGYYRTLTEHWDGNQWSIVPSPNVGMPNNQFWDVAAISHDDVWAVGYYAVSSGDMLTLVEHWDGSQWSIVPSPNPPGAIGTVLFGVSAVSTNDVWAGGHYGVEAGTGGTLAEHWDGNQWNIVPSPDAGTGQSVFWDISALSATDVWAAGYYCCGGNQALTLVEHWNGSQWSIVPSPNPTTFSNRLNGIAAVSASDVWAAGYSTAGTGTWQTLTEHYALSNPCATPTPTATPSLRLTPTSTITASTPTRTPTECPMSFTDVHPTDYFYQAVRYLYCRGVISGYADGTFRPSANATRGQLCKIVVLAEGFPIYTPPMPTFRDVPITQTFYQYIETAYHQGIISGYSCGANCLEFRPSDSVTRGQLCKIIVLAEQWPLYTPPMPTFRDVPTTHTFYQYIETTYQHNIISGYSCGTGCLEFRPTNSATRGQICKIVYNAVTAP